MACSGGCGVHAASVPAGCNARLAAAPAGRYTPAMKDGIETRLHVAAPLNQGAAVELAAGQTHYLRSVLRLAPGAAVALRSEEHMSELQSLMRISYAVFCLKKNKKHF